MTLPPVRILGLATRQPACRIGQDDAAVVAAERCSDTAKQAGVLRALYRRSTVQQRGSVLLSGSNGHAAATISEFYPAARDAADRGPTTARRMARFAEDAPRLLEAVARDAMRKAGASPAGIDQVVIVTCTGLQSPGLDVHLIRELGLRATTGRTIVGFMGCHGAVNGLRVAHRMAAAGEVVLLAAVELCSLHFQYGWDPDKVVANALFADGAAAAVLAPGRPASEGEGNCNTPVLRATGSCLIPDSEGDMTWIIGDHGFEMTLSARVPDLIARHLRPWLTAWLAGHGLTLDQVQRWAVHPGGPRIVAAVEQALDLPAEATAVSREVLAECGNMSSPTLLFILDRLSGDAAPAPTVALAFGPGLMAEAALLGCSLKPGDPAEPCLG